MTPQSTSVGFRFPAPMSLFSRTPTHFTFSFLRNCLQLNSFFPPGLRPSLRFAISLMSSAAKPAYASIDPLLFLFFFLFFALIYVNWAMLWRHFHAGDATSASASWFDAGPWVIKRRRTDEKCKKTPPRRTTNPCLRWAIPFFFLFFFFFFFFFNFTVAHLLNL